MYTLLCGNISCTGNKIVVIWQMIDENSQVQVNIINNHLIIEKLQVNYTTY